MIEFKIALIDLLKTRHNIVCFADEENISRFMIAILVVCFFSHSEKRPFTLGYDTNKILKNTEILAG